MKRKTGLLLIALFVGISLQLSSCKNKEKEAEDTITEFLDAIEKHDFEKAKEKSTPETQKILVLVEEENEKYKAENKDDVKITYEIINRDIKDDGCKFKIKLIVGEKESVETIKLTLVEEKWLVIMPEKQVSILRFVVFRNRYHIFIKEHNDHSYRKYVKKTKKHKTKKTKKKH